MRKFLMLFLILPFLASASNNWEAKFKKERSIVENKGQFDFKGLDDMSNVKFVMEGSAQRVYFTTTGVVYEFNKLEKVEKTKLEKDWRENRKKQGFNSLEEWQEFERLGTRISIESDRLNCMWVGSNPNPEIIPSEKTTYTHTYTYFDRNFKQKSINNVKSYKTLTYKNVYPNIDIIYEIHPEVGIKYSVVVNPGGDVNKVKLNYSKKPLLLADGSVVTKMLSGDIIDHKPFTFYSSNKNQEISSSYQLNGNVISFYVANFDHTKKIVIDPWTQTPNYNTNWDCVWETETDATGNVYIIGGVMPLVLQKYNAAGVLQWTYNTPYDTTMWLGSFATDDAGNSYVSNGSSAQIVKVSTAGAVVWNNTSPGGLLGSTEFWNITFNCDQTKLVIGGTGGTLPPLPYIFDVDMASGNVTASVQVTGGTLIPTQEVRAVTPTSNEKYYFLTHDSIGYVDQGNSSCNSGFSPSFHVENGGYALDYKCENWRYNNSGVEALAFYDGFVYVNRGNQIHKRAFATAAIVATATIPSGVFGIPNPPFASLKQVANSGIAIDDCGNIFVGSVNQVVQFNTSLTQIATFPTAFNVYDVEISTAGNIVAAGSTGNSSSSNRVGTVQSIAVSACAQQATICCNPSICPVEPVCVTNPPITLTPYESGGTWTPASGLNTSTGVFNPSAVSPGDYTFYYSLPCGTDSIIVKVGACTPISVCVEANGDLTVSGGDGPFTWAEGETTPTCISGLGIYCGPLTAQGPSVLQWTGFASGVTVTPPVGADTIRVMDAFGTTNTITNIATLPACSASCDATITQAGPFCSNASSVNLTAAETGGTWSGTGITNASTGTFNPTTAGAGSHVITYNLTCGDTDTMTIVVNAGDDANFTYPSGSYCLSDPNPTPSAPITSGGVFTINGTGVINSSTGVINIGSSGIGNYVVTYTTSGACPDTATFNVAITNSTDATITQVGPFCSNAASVNLTAVSPGGTWTGTGITNGTTGTFNPATAGAGSHVITYTISGSCGSVDTMTIVVNAAQSAAFTYASSSFCLTDPNPTPTITGATGGTFTINNSGVINSSTGVINITGSGAGSFVVTYTTAGPCPASQTFNVTINSCTAPLPVANFSASQTNICIGDCISFTDLSNSSATGGITAWSWTFTGATPSTFNAQTPTNICYNTAGTYQVVLTVTDANGVDTETKTAYITVTSCATPITNFSVSDSTICSGSCINFTDLSTGATSWQWSFQNGTPPTSSAQNPTNICFDVSGTHEIKLVTSNAFGSDSLIKYVTVFQTQQVFVGNDTTIQLGQSVNLNATGLSSNGVYSWTPPIDLSCITCPNPISTPEETITYTVITTDSNGCKSTDNINIIVLFENVIFVPNIFSPNGDGINDILFVRGKGVEKLKFFIYDRWGEKVFETTSLDVGWDGSFRGKDMNKAVFVYYLEATFIDGQEVTQKGDITLVK